jgi:beta-lactamase regulating signal transducer with metallopeptidase domain
VNATALQSLSEGVLRASWQASVLAGVILVIQAAMGRRISARARYGLWSLVLLRLALPVNLPSPVSLHNLYPPPRVQSANLPPVIDVAVGLPMTAPAPTVAARPSDAIIPPPANRMTWAQWLATAWAIGVGVALLLVIVASLRLSLHVRRQRRVADERVIGLLKSCAADLGVRRLPELLTGPCAGGPALVGFVRPKVLLPETVLAFEDEALRLILLHELAHQRRRDVPANWVLALLQAVHWFNPVVHLAFARVRADRELACDERVLSLSNPSDRPAYGRTIVRLIESLSNAPRVPAPAVGILEGGHQLRRRIAMIAEHRPVRRAWSLVALVAAGAFAAVACTDAVRGGDAPKVDVTVQPADAPRPVDPALPGNESNPVSVTPTFSAVPIGVPPTDRRLAKRLPEIKLDGIPLNDALAYVRDVAGINLFVDRRAIETSGVELDSPVTLDLKDITVDQAFRLIGKSAAPTGVNLAAHADGDVIVFGVSAPPQPAAMPGMMDPAGFGMEGAPPPAGQPMGFANLPRRGPAEKAITRVYSVDPLCGNDADKLQTLTQVVMTSMNVGKSSALVAIQPFNGKLVVTATPDLQDQVTELLKMLKETAPGEVATKPAAKPPAF